jgi:exonuclease III
MRIVSWNCGGRIYGGFNNEKSRVLFDKNGSEKNMDILVIQEITLEECVDLDKTWESRFWYGDGSDNSYSGVAIFSKKRNIEFTNEFDRKHRYIIPYKVTVETNRVFTLYAIWTKGQEYEKHIFNAMRDCKAKSYSMLIGDFNVFANANNKRLEELTKELDPLKNCALFNGKENDPTFACRRFGKGTDDFCFSSADITITDFRIGDHGDRSDHCPIIVEFDLSTQSTR